MDQGDEKIFNNFDVGKNISDDIDAKYGKYSYDGKVADLQNPASDVSGQADGVDPVPHCDDDRVQDVDGDGAVVGLDVGVEEEVAAQLDHVHHHAVCGPSQRVASTARCCLWGCLVSGSSKKVIKIR